MITLVDSVKINVSLNTLYKWLYALDENFVKWSPYHLSFEKVTGGWAVGEKIRFKEVVMGVTYDIKGVIFEHTKTDNDFSIGFESMSGFGRIYFKGGVTDNGCRFTHIEKFGKPETTWGRFLNWLLFEVLFKKKANWQLIKEDMVEDNIYLKNILETGKKVKSSK
jgi:hypothetical protein